MTDYSYSIKNQEIEKAQFLGARELGDIVRICEKSLDKLQVRADDGSSIVRTFIGSYYSLNKKFAEKNVFANPRTNRIVATYFASNTVLNVLYSDLVQALYSTDPSPYQDSGLITGDMECKSNRSYLNNVLKKLSSSTQHSDVKTVRYNTFTFFEYLKNLSRLEITNEPYGNTQKIFSELDITGEGLNFKDVKKKSKGSSNGNGSTSNGENDSTSKAPIYVDATPQEPADYEPEKTALTKYVIGNGKELAEMQGYFEMHAWFNPSTGKNRLRNKYPQNLLLFGGRGVGKNYTTDAVLNYIVAETKKKGIDPIIKSLRDVSSIYKDGAVLRLKNQYAYLKEQKNRLVYVVFDEFDGLFPKSQNGQNGEELKKLVAEFKIIFDPDKMPDNIMTIAMTNYASEDKIESAIKNRFLPIHIPGPQTEKDYAQMLWKESLLKIERVSEHIQWMNLGKQVFDHKESGCTATGRDCANIVKSLYRDFNQETLAKIKEGIGAPIERQESLMSHLFPLPDQEMYVRTIDAYFDNQNKSEQDQLSKKPILAEVFT